MKTSEKRHMINIPEKDFVVIHEYCRNKNLILGRWISSVCISHIKSIISGSFYEYKK